MSEKVLHLGLKILSSIKHSSTGEEIEVIPEYLSMIDKKGFAWYNKSKYWEEQTQGSKLAKKRIEVLQKQFDDGVETKLYLFENVPSERFTKRRYELFRNIIQLMHLRSINDLAKLIIF